MNNEESIAFLQKLEEVIQDRLANPTEGSYTSKIAQKGVNKVAQKVGEEAVETVIEATNGTDELLKEESADLIYHLLLLLNYKGITLSDVVKVLEERHK
ncbi:MAG TPA: phosphoribosyl-ATP diphosphatase [Microscillaceae bacterium]|nr:phosphoribosyl-ATP diphosphatase [Microscillaceae bacterium]